MNDVIDQLALRDAAIDRHVPEAALFLLYGTFLILGVLLGYGAGLSRTRLQGPVLVMPFLIVALIFLVIDLDLPRRGVIQVDQGPLLALAGTVGIEAGVGE